MGKKENYKRKRKLRISDRKIAVKSLKVGIASLIVAIVSLVVALIIAIFLDYFGIHYSDNPTADIQNQAIDASYLLGLGNRQNKFPMFNDDVDETKEYICFDKCATQVLVTNDYDNEILLEKMVFEAKEIKADETPVLRLDVAPRDNDSAVNIICVNEGWGKAKNVTITLEGEGLKDIIPFDKHSVYLSSIDAKEQIKLPIWSSSDVIKKDCVKDLNLFAKCRDADGNDIPVRYAMGDSIYLGICNGRFNFGGENGPSEDIYGVKIDTTYDTYEYTFNISESIKDKERIEVPICFFSDKSCTLKFRVKFTAVYKNKRIPVETDWAELKFQVSSVSNYNLNDVREFSKEKLIEMIHEYPGEVIVTYPAVDRTEMENIEPIFDIDM